MRTKIALVCFLSSMAFGQFASMSMRRDGDTMTVTLGQPIGYRGPAITGAPYSGEQVSEHSQTLADGTHISQPRNIQKMWRDSQGRTRNERDIGGGYQPDKNGGFALVEIHDLVEGFSYVLDDQNKVAHRFTLTAPPVRQRVAPPQTATAPVRARPQPTSEKLGTQNIEGVIAEGTRMTNTIPIGEMGNDRALVTTNEMWFSSELKMTVLSKYSDPRNGETTMRMTNISRAEPDPALFMPPAGYAIVDEKDSFTMTLKKQ
jgi:hypothetical protein